MFFKHRSWGNIKVKLITTKVVQQDKSHFSPLFLCYHFVVLFVYLCTVVITLAIVICLALWWFTIIILYLNKYHTWRQDHQVSSNIRYKHLPKLMVHHFCQSSLTFVMLCKNHISNQYFSSLCRCHVIKVLCLKFSSEKRIWCYFDAQYVNDVFYNRMIRATSVSAHIRISVRLQFSSSHKFVSESMFVTFICSHLFDILMVKIFKYQWNFHILKKLHNYIV